MRKVDVAIIGAGTAGLSARSEVKKFTNNYVIIDDGPLGTTCARVGCMPSKVLIEVANTFHRRNVFSELGITGADSLSLNGVAVMNHVRSLRDRFVRSVRESMQSWESEKLIRKRAQFIDRNTLQVGDERIEARSIIIATGSKPVLPQEWKPYQEFLFDTDTFFELEQLPKSVAVLGLGVIGIELGQALHRLGVDVTTFTANNRIGGITDPEIQNYAMAHFEKEFPIVQGRACVKGVEDGKLVIAVGEKTWKVDKAFLTMGRTPSLSELGLEKLGLPLADNGLPKFSRETFQIEGTRIFIAGDVNGERPILHEASDQGHISGHNAGKDSPSHFQSRTPLAIVFSDPNIAMIGARHADLQANGVDFVVGEVDFRGYGRAIVMRKEYGRLRIYGEKKTGKLLGAELFAPGGEHLAHLLSWAISMGLTVRDAIALPYYHPVLEEAILTALRDLKHKLDVPAADMELFERT